MKDWQSQTHVKWDCKCHVVIVPKYRQRLFFGGRRKQNGGILWELCRQKEISLVNGKCNPGSPRVDENGWNFVSTEIRVTRICVSTVGLDETMIRRSIRNHEQHERDQERGLFDNDK